MKHLKPSQIQKRSLKFVMRAAHEATKAALRAGDDYRATFAIALKQAMQRREADYVLAVKMAEIEEAKAKKRAEKSKELRKAANALGGKALKGSSKQKVWAEELRKKFLAAVDSEVAERALTAEHAQHSKFWIDTRFSSYAEISNALADASLVDALTEKTKQKAFEQKYKNLSLAGFRR